MPPEPAILAFDTSAAHCAAAVLLGGAIAACRVEEMATGQAERLMPMLEDVLAEAGAGWRDLGAVAVGTGPGNFTGVRIAVAAARGLALALAVPAAGVSGFRVLAAGGAAGGAADTAAGGPLLVTLPAPRGMVHAAVLADGAEGAPFLLDPAAPGLPAGLPPGLPGFARPLRVAGSHGAAIGAALGLPGEDRAVRPAPELIARLAAQSLAAGAALPRPAPVYVRPPDAALPATPPPVILP